MDSKSNRKIAVVGLGYVGLPVAIAFARAGILTIGFDIDRQRIAELVAGRDRTHEIDASELASAPVRYTANAADLADGDFFIVTVPTPVDVARRPDMSMVLAASHTVGEVMRPGAIVVYESTVYPGATEEDCVPVLEKASGLVCGRDFHVGYSPERINPGDKVHRFESITKIVSGRDEATLDIVAEVYGCVVKAGVFRAASIRVAEAAKVIENAQRDINIAFMNELSAVFHLLNIDTNDVLTAARTKWNFLPFTPGLVGGHCIGVDPYYLTHIAEIAGYHPQVILSGRRINDGVGSRVALECLRLMAKLGSAGRTVTLLGLTFKENVPDIRNSRVIDIIGVLQDHNIRVQIADPLAIPAEAEHEYGVSIARLSQLEPADAVILAVPHDEYLTQGWGLVERLLAPSAGIVLDVKGVLPRDKKPDRIALWRL
ncbi:nucleotide sugar dehydrogenase [Methylocystis sp.]|uniref:nucleotide sugar dehydrogenase n=1 Tax=Methylocystis sp. TaxID=1911079 RepID=UPI003DA228CD